jgi:predicted nucleic acid-binding protein
VSGATLDAGALIAIERGEPRLQALLDEAAAAGLGIAVPAGVIAQAWRGSSRQARLARFLALSAVTTVPLDEPEARAAGVLCGRTGTSDVVDASVVICARARGHAVVTGDPGDLAALDPALRLVRL